MKNFERLHGTRFDWVIKSRPDVAINRPVDWSSLLRSSSATAHAILARARCWPHGRLPRHSWTYGHTRCGDQALSDDAFFLARRVDADAVFSRFDEALMKPPYPRCNVSFKALVAAECVFTTHLRQRGIAFSPTSFDISIASKPNTSLEEQAARPPPAASPRSPSPNHGRVPEAAVCAARASAAA